MIITARFASICPCCSVRIEAGSSVEWTRGEKAKHPACAGVTMPASTPVTAGPSVASTTSRNVTVERVGRRSYLRGDTYSVRNLLKNAGCHWDRDQSAWWIGDNAVALDLAAKAATAPAAPPSEPARSFARRSSGRRFGSGHGSAAPVAGYSSYCTDNASCRCYDCAS